LSFLSPPQDLLLVPVLLLLSSPAPPPSAISTLSLHDALPIFTHITGLAELFYSRWQSPHAFVVFGHGFAGCDGFTYTLITLGDTLVPPCFVRPFVNARL